MLRRRRPLLRAAAVGGTAYAVGRHWSRQREEAGERGGRSGPAHRGPRGAAAGAPRPSTSSPRRSQQPPPRRRSRPCSTSSTSSPTLHQQGALTDEEFAAAKAKLLG